MTPLDWFSFVTGALSVSFAYALFKDHDMEDPPVEDEDYEELTGRHVTLSCQSCRKLKKHREIELNLYQCTTCKREVDLR